MQAPSDDNIDRREALQRVVALFGATLIRPQFQSALVNSAAAMRASANFAPRALSPEQLEQVATIAERIIPTTDTPGARSAGVHRFIDIMLAEYYTTAEREHFLAGLADIDARARREYGRPFLACTEDNQRSLVEHIDDETFAPAPTAAAVANAASRATERGGGGLAAPTTDERQQHSLPPFFRTMKELTLLGYYTSQPGATKELRYLQVPGRFDGCVPFSTVGRTWAT